MSILTKRVHEKFSIHDACDATGSIARSCAQNKRYSQKSGDSNECFAVTCQILAWRFVQAEKFCGSQSGGRDRRRRKEQKRRGSG